MIDLGAAFFWGSSPMRFDICQYGVPLKCEKHAIDSCLKFFFAVRSGAGLLYRIRGNSCLSPCEILSRSFGSDLPFTFLIPRFTVAIGNISWEHVLQSQEIKNFFVVLLLISCSISINDILSQLFRTSAVKCFVL